MSEISSYDVVIIGSGMGGLACANILLREGLSVVILERNRQLGGNMQIFSRDKRIFDTGVHYVGGLDNGQILHTLFTYFGIIDRLKLRRMDEDGFDHIFFGNDCTAYKYGMGYENFKNQLIDIFPLEKKAIDTYCASIQNIVKNLPLAQLKEDNLEMITQIDFKLNAKEYINSLTENKTLRKVFAGNNALYAASEKTPFYVHALVLHYYIESSYKGVDGFGQIPKEMAKVIRQLGGEIKTRSEVINVTYNEKNEIESVVLENGQPIRGKYFISNAHPTVTIQLFGKDRFPKSYVQRITNLENTEGMFVLHIALKDNMLEYKNHNIFQVDNEDVWDLTYNHKTWPNFYMISMPPNSSNPNFAKSLSVICGMSWQEVAKWSMTYNNEINPKSRGKEYEEFKEFKSQLVLTAIEKHLPNIRSMIVSYSASTPLTQRDYTGSPEGTGYGIAKDSANPFKTMINTKTPITNLFLTGQNITLHGLLGVSLTAILTAGNIVDKKVILQKINSI